MNLFEIVGGAPLTVFAVIVILVLLAVFVSSRYRVASANEALIRTGRVRRDGPAALTVVVGGGIVVLPVLHRIGRLKLTARQISVALTDAVSRQGIKVAVQGVATFKIGNDAESIRNAAERFLEAREDEVDSIVKNVLEGSLRSIVGTLTIEELNLDRQKFQQAVQDAAKGDLATTGLQIDSFTIQTIRDESGYMDLIGQQQIAQRERDARMAKATADQEAAVREAEAQQIKINAERDVSLRRAETQMQVMAAEARASQAGPLAQAEAQQEVTRRQTELAELAAARTANELLATTVKPAAAEREATIQRAEGDKRARIAQAEAEAERTKLEGNAEAAVTFTKGEAEAKALAMRAEAYKQFNEAAVITAVLAALPEIVRAAAEPMGRIGSLTVLSSDGASEVVRNATRAVAETGAVVKGLTGIDVPQLIENAMGSRFGGTEPRSPEPGPAARPMAEESGSTTGMTTAAAALDMGDERDATEPGAAPPAETIVTIAPDAGANDPGLADLAARFGRYPNIQRYASTRLSELAEGGPRPLRLAWGVAGAEIQARYGGLTIGELLRRAGARGA